MIRPLNASDEKDLARFFEKNDCPEITANFHPFPLDAETARALCREETADRYFVSVQDGNIVGFSMLRGWKEGYAIPSFGLLVDRECAGRGIGSGMLEHATEVAKKLGCGQVRLTVEPGNDRAIRIYTRAGFTLAEKKPDGRLVMTLSLS